MEKLLVKPEEQIRKIFELIVLNTPASIVVTDCSGQIEYVNPKFCDLTGYTAQEMVGQNPRILKSGEKSAEEYKNLWSTISSGKVWRGRFHNKKKSGEYYWESAVITPVIGADGSITNFIAIKEDISTIVEDEILLELKNRKLKEIAVLQSHTVRGPLATMIGLLNLIKAEKSETSKFELLNSLDTIAKQFDEIIHLINCKTDEIQSTIIEKNAP